MSDLFHTRRTPVYLLLDCSGSMIGEPMERVRSAISDLVLGLQQDPVALETVWLSLITFENSAIQAVPLTPIDAFQIPVIEPTGTTSLGQALTLLKDCIDYEVRKATPTQKGDFRPLVFIITDGEPTDSWREPADEIKRLQICKIIACVVGNNLDVRFLNDISDTVTPTLCR